MGDDGSQRHQAERRALRDVSPNSFNPRIVNAMTRAEKLRDISKLIGKSVNMMKVTITNGSRRYRSA